MTIEKEKKNISKDDVGYSSDPGFSVTQLIIGISLKADIQSELRELKKKMKQYFTSEQLV